MKTLCISFAAFLSFSSIFLAAQTVPSPKEHFGFSIGDDYHLANFTQTDSYFKKLAATSERVLYVDIGPTEEGRRQPMLIISSPANLANLEYYRSISKELALAENPNAIHARAQAVDGRAVVWFDGSIHATESLGIHQLIETAYILATRNDQETLYILDNVIILIGHPNPDGHELAADWYNRRPNATTNEKGTLPRLYQKYAGHDNNYDFYMNNLKETANINRQLYVEWFPQIVFDAHQGGALGVPAGTIVSTMPWNDPFNYVIDPLVIAQSMEIGGAMHSSWIAENMPGTSMRGGSMFALWQGGGMRITPYFHNMVGILTETAGSPTPTQLPLVPSRQIATSDYLWPISSQLWHYRRSIEYSITANYAVLDYAARNRDRLLYNIYLMGRNSIERGNRDHWTRLPSHVEAMTLAASKTTASDPIDPSFFELLQRPEFRDPRAFIITSDPAVQYDRAAVSKFINTLSNCGITIHKATEAFTVENKTYPKGSYVVKAAQAFRPFLLSMFEPQKYPMDFLTKSASHITPPYDIAGWTPAIQMGIAFDRILDALPDSLPLERLPLGHSVNPLPGTITSQSSSTPVTGFLVSHRPNHSFTLSNRLLKAGADIYWLNSDITVSGITPGTLYIPASSVSTPIVTGAVSELGLDAIATSSLPKGVTMLKLSPSRIALWDRYSGSVFSGWVRWILEQYEYEYDLIYVQQIDESSTLRDRYDVIIFANDAIPPRREDNLPVPRSSPYPSIQPKPENLPEQFHHLLGTITAEKTIPSLQRFLEQGGSIVTIGSSTCLAYYLGLPVGNALLEKLPDGKQRLFSSNQFQVPGSILKAKYNPEVPLAWGMERTGPVFFDRDPLFTLTPEAATYGMRVAAWLDKDNYLLSGLVWDKRGNDNTGGVLAIEASVGDGNLYLLAPEVTFRAQPHATFKLLFNPLHLSTAIEIIVQQN